jgi:hypothetical protein
MQQLADGGKGFPLPPGTLRQHASHLFDLACDLAKF